MINRGVGDDHLHLPRVLLDGGDGGSIRRGALGQEDLYNVTRYEFLAVLSIVSNTISTIVETNEI